MHALRVAARPDNAGDMRAVAMGVIDAGAGEIARFQNARGKIGMIGIDTGIGDGHKAAEPGPAARIGGAEPGGGKRCPAAAVMIFGCFIKGRVRNRARGRQPGLVWATRIGCAAHRRTVTVNPVAAIDKHHRPGGRQATAATATAAGKTEHQTEHETGHQTGRQTGNERGPGQQVRPGQTGRDRKGGQAEHGRWPAIM